MARPGMDPAPPPPLLRLPPSIRQRIYRFVGLASWNGSPYIFNLQGPDPDSESFWAEEEPSPSTFHGLLLSCRHIYAEAAALLYSTNRFVLHYTAPGSLKPLLALTAPVISSLAHLKVVLNETSCHHRDLAYYELDCCVFDTLSCSEPHHHHQPQLLSSASDLADDKNSPSARTQVLLNEWRAAASHLSSSITSNYLELSVVCDIDAEQEETVDLCNSVLEPLRLFPLLRGCHIRLCSTPDSRLCQAAEDAVLQSCGIAGPYLRPSSTNQSITFLTLPRELRLCILEFTDLVTPSKEVWWCRKKSKYHWQDFAGEMDCLDNSPSRSGCQFLECWYRTQTHRFNEEGSPIGCFCRRRHAAFSTTCTCWVPPGPALFLVCQALCQDARLVFFSTNHFVVHDLHMFPPYWYGSARGDYPYERLAASQFLRQVIPTHCIAYLRFLELVFPPYLPKAWPQTSHPAMQDWRETVSWLRDEINGPALTLRLVGADIKHWIVTPPHQIRTVAQGDMIHSAYMGILQALKPLADGPNRIVRFYADLPNPWQWTRAALRRRRDKEGYEEALVEKRDLKWSAERQVLGDRFDSQYSNDKEEPEQSLWQHGVYHHDW